MINGKDGFVLMAI